MTSGPTRHPGSRRSRPQTRDWTDPRNGGGPGCGQTTAGTRRGRRPRAEPGSGARARPCGGDPQGGAPMHLNRTRSSHCTPGQPHAGLGMSPGHLYRPLTVPTEALAGPTHSSGEAGLRPWPASPLPPQNHGHQGGLGQQRNQPNRLQPTPGHWAPGLRTELPANAPEQAVPPGHRGDPRKGKSHQLQTPPRTRPERASPVPQLAWTGRQAPGSRSGQALGFPGGCEHGGGRATASC